MTRLLLVRHGESKANRNNLFAGYSDFELEENGITQAKLTAKYIYDNYKVDKVYSSDLKRAFATGKIIADLFGLDVITRADLKEINGGLWESVPFSSLSETHPDEFAVWDTDFASAICPGGESVADLADRIMPAITEIAEANDNKTVVIATHATVIRVIQAIVQTGSLSASNDLPWVSNASVSVLEYKDGNLNFTKISEDKHLGELITTLDLDI